jgi:peptidoglycan/xylan/chitin deacetylase (PgdA/CDA1 family)
VFYDYLASQKQKATMFFIGSNVMNWPLEAQRALADGHQICIRAWFTSFGVSVA